MVVGKGAKGRRKTVDKWKKKQWFSIVASKLFDNRPLSETPAEKGYQLEGRTIKVTLDKLTGQRKRRDTVITFKNDSVQGQTINTKVSKFEVNKGTLGRMIRRRNSKVSLITKIPVEGGDAKITLIAVTYQKATQAQKTSLRKLMQDELNTLKNKDFEMVVKKLLLENFTGDITKKANKICVIKKIVAAKAVFIKSK